jgi:hypothetical protein
MCLERKKDIRDISHVAHASGDRHVERASGHDSHIKAPAIPPPVEIEQNHIPFEYHAVRWGCHSDSHTEGSLGVETGRKGDTTHRR